MKTCSRCKENKSLNHYCKSKIARDGLQKYCKTCAKAIHKEWSGKKSDRQKAYRSAKYYNEVSNIEPVDIELTLSSDVSINSFREMYEAWIESNRCKNDLKREHDKRCNTQQVLDRKKKYDKMWKISKSTDPVYRLRRILRIRLNTAAKRGYKTGSAVRDLGCSIEELKVYLESKFQPDMSWDNWSPTGWHIDHVVPLGSTRSLEEAIKLCHYTNLQPLWAHDNLVKSNKLTVNEGLNE
jgi:hypothetical protein